MLTRAHVTLDPGGKLRDDSVITIGDQTMVVPARDGRGWRIAPCRILYAADLLGYRAVDYYGSGTHDDNDGFSFDVIRKKVDR